MTLLRVLQVLGEESYPTVRLMRQLPCLILNRNLGIVDNIQDGG